MTEQSDRERRRAEALPLQTLLGEKIVSTANTLQPEQWARPTNCPPWVVKTIVAHLVRNAEMFSMMLDTGLSGGKTFPQTPEQREERQRELSAMPNAELVATFDSRHRALRDRLAGLSATELEQPCPHPRWLMPAWWVVDQRIVELAFHAWDLETSIGHDTEIDPEIAQFMLPAIVENNLPLFHRPDEAHAGSWALHATDIENGRWRIQSTGSGADVSRDSSPADVTIEGAAPVLARWLYGRASLADLERAGRARVTGDSDRLEQWREAFPSP